jgi:hypothetical protein
VAKECEGFIMRICQSFFIALMVVLLSISFAFAEDLNGGWEEVAESDGIIGYARYSSGSSVNEIKAIGTVNASVAVIESVLRDEAAKTEYTYMCSEGYRIDTPNLQSTKDNYYSYHKVDMPWPFYDRDLVAKVEVRIDEATGALLIKIQSISSDFKAEDYYTVRIPSTKAKWILTPMGENKTKVLYQILTDPGGYMPGFAVNLVSNDMAVSTIASLRKMVKKEKYKNAKAIVTTTPWLH